MTVRYIDFLEAAFKGSRSLEEMNIKSEIAFGENFISMMSKFAKKAHKAINAKELLEDFHDRSKLRLIMDRMNRFMIDKMYGKNRPITEPLQDITINGITLKDRCRTIDYERKLTEELEIDV